MDNRSALRLFFSAIFIAAIFRVPFPIRAAAESGTLLTGKAAMGDWKSDAPGVRRKITVQDLPPPRSPIPPINPTPPATPPPRHPPPPPPPLPTQPDPDNS